MTTKLMVLATGIMLVAHSAYANKDAQGFEVDENGKHAWSWNVPEENIQRGRELLFEGNKAFNEGRFRQAAATYKQALEAWNAPIIRYIYAMSLVNLNQPLEGRANLVESIKYGTYGPSRESREKYQRALDNIKIIEQQLVQIKIRSDLPGAKIEVDGKTIMTMPGEFQGWVRPGTHSIIASKDKYLTRVVSRVFEAGERPEIDMKLVTLDIATEYQRRWPRSKGPWATTITGAAITASGGALYYFGNKRVGDYDSDTKSKCSDGGCSSRNLIRVTQGRRMQTIGAGTLAVGGATLITGAVLVYLNRQRPDLASDPYKSIDAEKKADIVPVFSEDRVGFSLNINF